MIEVITLENMNVRTIYQVFHDAFTGYFVTFEDKPEIHIERWLSAGVDFALSYGVKIDGKLVAFILHAPCEDMVMNLATGVRKEFQGQGLTGLMYERILRELPQKGFKKSRLEVITENMKAIRAYEKVGFARVRKLLSWKGHLQKIPFCDGHHLIKPFQLTKEHKALIKFPYAFEQREEVLLRRSAMLELHELRKGKDLLAYAVWNPLTMYLAQLEGHSPESLASLLSSMKLSGEHVGIINVDEQNEILNRFFQNSGLTNFISQYEMEILL